jgi:recombination protein RecA
MLGDKGAEELLDVIEAFIRQLSSIQGLLRGVVVNSVAGLTPSDELNTVHKQQHMGLQARLMSKHMRKINAIAHKTKCTIIYINQIRDKISTYGAPTVTSGGRALKFYASQRIELRKAGEGNANWDVLRMMKINAKVHKNRLSRGNPFKSTSFYAVYGQGIDSGIEIAELAVTNGLILRSGGWYTYKDQKFNGNMKLLEFINTNLEVKQELYDAIYDSFIRTTDIEITEQQAIQQVEAADTAEFNNIEYEEAVAADQIPIE